MQRRPNVLIIMTDQQSADAMSCRMGDTFIRTPAMDSLAARGLLFTRAYCANPLCIPHRTAMFTGRFPHETGAQTNDRVPVDPAANPCLGTLFRRAGYDTGYVGKWHILLPKDDVDSHGFEFTVNLRNNAGDGATAGPAAEFLARKRDKPFLLVASFINPHNICEWARGEKLPEGPIGEPPPPAECPPGPTNGEPPAGETEIMALMRRSYQGTRMFPVGEFTRDRWRQYRWAYYRMIEKVDREIGKVLKALRESGAERDTLIVFTSDHGDCQGAHRWNQKTVFYEEATRVPLILAGPETASAATCDELVQTGVDLLPTLGELAGVPVPEGLHGESFARAARTGTAAKRPFVVVSSKMVQGAPVDGVKPTPEGRMVRSEDFKYWVFDRPDSETLFDLRRDPGETVNLAGDPAHAAEVRRHREFLARHAATTHDAFPLPNG